MSYKMVQPDGRVLCLRQVQLKQLELLRVFHNFCLKNGLRYFLCGGCCIGAFRHGGFVPWDDDIDVHMPRPDYEKLSLLWNKDETLNSRYLLCRTNKNKFYDTMLTAIVDSETTFVKKGQEKLDIPHGFRLEVIPLDGAPSSKLGRTIQLFWSLSFYLFNRGFAPENRGVLVRWLGKCVLFLIRGPRARYFFWKYCEKKMTRYDFETADFVTELTVTWKYMKIRYPKRLFSAVRTIKFEGMDVNVCAGADEYLALAFGNYMTFPPESKRIPKHDAIVIDTERPFEDYRGIFF